MNGLRMYTRSSSIRSTEGDAVFYSRRADGPLYRWAFEEKQGCWQVSRMPSSKLTLGELAHARWNGLPPALQARLRDHYLE